MQEPLTFHCRGLGGHAGVVDQDLNFAGDELRQIIHSLLVLQIHLELSTG